MDGSKWNEIYMNDYDLIKTSLLKKYMVLRIFRCDGIAIVHDKTTIWRAILFTREFVELEWKDIRISTDFKLYATG